MNIRILAAVSALTFAFATASAAAPTLDAKGKCRDNGKFVAASMCKAPAKQVCKDAKGKFAKCGTPGAMPVKK